jgi:serine/threonine-protein kinase
VATLIGHQLGEYILEAELGRGSMGIVYRARHATLGTPAAVKVLLDVLSTDISFITRFIREARVIAGLHHPNIIQVFDAGRQGDHIYFAMEYFQGETAAQMLRERTQLPAPQVIEIAIQAADALDYAHEHGHLVHRDIKPENLLVDERNHVKLLDFGLARVDGTRSITQVGTVVGSLYYVSPEQLRGLKLDGRADVYALGVSMYEMLTGQRPYVGQTLSEMSDAILGARAIPPTQLDPTVPPELEAIIARAMMRDLDQRYRTAGQLRNDLRALQTILSNRSGIRPPTEMSETLPTQRLSAQPAPQETAPTQALPAPAMAAYAPRPSNAPTRQPRTAFRATALEPVPAEQRDSHFSNHPRPPDPQR